MFRIILELFFPLIVTLYLIIDVFIPAFSNKDFFWFIKSFLKPEETFEEEVKEAERAFKYAKKRTSDLQDTASEEAIKAKGKLKIAEDALIKAKENLERFNKKINKTK